MYKRQPPCPPLGNNDGNHPAVEASSKRKKGATLNTAYVYGIARPIQNRTGMAVRSDEAENRLFRDFFGCGAHLVVILWKMMDALDLLPAEVEVVHLLWTLYWLKCYPTESPATAAVGRPGHKVDPKTFRKYVQPIVFAVSDLEPHVVSKKCTIC